MTWTAIGAGASGSQTHRNLASGLSTPVGFKNGPDGDLEGAVNGIIAAGAPARVPRHQRPGALRGHPHAREPPRAPRPARRRIARTSTASPSRWRSRRSRRPGAPTRILIDCSHANSWSRPELQPLVARDVVNQIRDGSRSIFGLMLESFIEPGSQPIPADLSQLRYGCSVTDPCLGWDATVEVLREMRARLRSVVARAGRGGRGHSATASGGAAPAALSLSRARVPRHPMSRRVVQPADAPDEFSRAGTVLAARAMSWFADSGEVHARATPIPRVVCRSRARAAPRRRAARPRPRSVRSSSGLRGSRTASRSSRRRRSSASRSSSGSIPRTIERFRAALEAPGVREDAARHFARTAAERRAAGSATAAARPPAPRDPEQLILAARQRADGLTLLFSAAPEAAAIAFGVHPDLVHGAREVATSRGLAGDVPTRRVRPVAP